MKKTVQKTQHKKPVSKIRIVILAFVALGVLGNLVMFITGIPSGYTGLPAELLNYSFRHYGLQMSVPETWRVVESNTGESSENATQLAYAFSKSFGVLSPQISISRILKEDENIDRLIAYWHAALPAGVIRTDARVNEIDLAILEFPGGDIPCAGTQNSPCLEVYFIHEGRGFRVEMNASANQWPIVEGVYRQMIESIRFE